MNPLVLATLQPMLAKLDVLHLLKVLTGGDQPTDSEFSVLQMVHRLLAAPIAGDFAWAKAVEFATSKGVDGLILSYIKAGLEAHNSDVPVPGDIESSRTAFQALLDEVITTADVPHLAAVSSCPSCGYLYGVMQ